MKKSEKIPLPTFGCLNLKTVFSAEIKFLLMILIFFKMFQKSKGQNLPLASLYRVKHALRWSLKVKFSFFLQIGYEGFSDKFHVFIDIYAKFN
jgi:hypothetical protein